MLTKMLSLSDIRCTTQTHDIYSQPRVLVGDDTSTSLNGDSIPNGYLYVDGIIRKITHDDITFDTYPTGGFLEVYVYNTHEHEGKTVVFSDSCFRKEIGGLIKKNDLSLVFFTNKNHKGNPYEYGFSIRQTRSQENFLIDFMKKIKNIAIKLEILTFNKNNTETVFQTKILIYNRLNNTLDECKIINKE
ncbi:hypothetical protein CDIK_1921 [Cucumispora dikerogammari]|nr:hypothetical protein CDIK_1921 [Cucumispora dikerogammari]